ncbi:MAG: hypothetical protein ACYS80_19765 [Planctomycetota bacterium]
MAERKEIPTGVVGLIAVILGIIGRIYVQWINAPGGGIEDASDIDIIVGASSAILLLVGGIISIVGAAKETGRVASVVGILLAVLFLILMFIPVST